MFIEIKRMTIGGDYSQLIKLDRIVEVNYSTNGCQLIMQDQEVICVPYSYDKFKAMLAYLGKYDPLVSELFLEGDKE
jgi:hypothetical protein